ncbi:beta-galactosidase (plasmid) [Haladaptatus sp. SPP-AMP-3]|uniref:beta-galactosidase n=1 Tax=Haladaptatus sp. SPP-AMP-3 TaxID=3121295 RepID=UPI003C2D4081
MSIGVCYFPEHWPRERWATDVEQMAEAGIEYVRMGEFSWSRLEPRPGELDFEWLETAVDLVHEHGMKAVLCTPTATPPKWLVDQHPDILQEEPDGGARHFGSRRHYCFNSETYREQTNRIVTALAEHFADHPAVVGWQTDNEYGCHDTIRCYCDDCATAFRIWLREKYGGIDTLNESWGTTFWSQHHSDFEEIDPPRHTVTDHHPGRLLDYHRFASASVVSYNRSQADRLREANDDWFVTHNFMFDFGQLDPYDVGDDLDFAAWDSYPTGFPQVADDDPADADELRVGNPDQIGFNHDRYRCAAPGNFWVMEQQPGAINWPPETTQPAEGAMRLWAHHAVAHGADVVSYFRWRRCLEGQEQYHAGLRKRDGTVDRGYHDATAAAAELADLDRGSVTAPVALVLDYESLWALDEQAMSPDFDYWNHLHTYYHALRGRGVQVDVLPADTDFEDYDAVLAPSLHLVGDDVESAFRRYVESGGHLLFTIRSGEKDPHNKLHATRPPGPLADLAGVRVDQHESVPADSPDAHLSYRDERYGYRTWAEWIDADDARVVGQYATGIGEGRTAITVREAEPGSVAYVGIWPDAELADALVSDVLTRANVTHAADPLPDRVRVAHRGDLTWVFNYSSEPIDVDVGDADVRLGEETVPGYDLLVIEGTPTDVAVER